MFHFPNLYPLVPAASSLHIISISWNVIYFKCFEISSFFPGSHYLGILPNIEFALPSLWDYYHPLPSLPLPPQHTCHKLKVFFFVAFFSTLYPLQFPISTLDLLSSCRKRSTRITIMALYL